MRTALSWFLLTLPLSIACGDDDGTPTPPAMDADGGTGTPPGSGAPVPFAGASLVDVDGTPAATGLVQFTRAASGAVTVTLGADFMQAMGPGDTELRLAVESTNAGEQLMADPSSVSDPLGIIDNGFSGSMTFEVPSSVDVASFEHVIIWCPSAGVNFGTGAIAGWTGTLEDVAETPPASGSVFIAPSADGHVITFGDDFMQGMGPGDTEIRLAKAATNAGEQLEADPTSVSAALGIIANGASGAQTATIPASVDPATFSHVIIWCPTAGVNFGVATLAAF